MAATEWMILDIQNLANSHGVPLVWTRYVRETWVYGQGPQDEYAEDVEAIIAKYGLHYRSTGPWLKAYYEETGEIVHTEGDGHWTAGAHQVLADNFADWIASEDCGAFSLVEN